LEKTSLKNHPKYSALSYAWGDPTLSQEIPIDSTKVSITKNTKVALQHPQDETEPVVIWIDAVCINQRDEHEKAEQVAKMKEIYEEAEHVLVWLGPSEDGTDELIDCLERIGKAYEELELTDITTWKLMELSKTPADPYSKTINNKLEHIYEISDHLFPDLFPWKEYQNS
jgi:hypothetical protein